MRGKKLDTVVFFRREQIHGWMLVIVSLLLILQKAAKHYNHANMLSRACGARAINRSDAESAHPSSFVRLPECTSYLNGRVRPMYLFGTNATSALHSIFQGWRTVPAENKTPLTDLMSSSWHQCSTNVLFVYLFLLFIAFCFQSLYDSRGDQAGIDCRSLICASITTRDRFRQRRNAIIY